jgi:hypothetical protein
MNFGGYTTEKCKKIFPPKAEYVKPGCGPKTKSVKSNFIVGIAKNYV